MIKSELRATLLNEINSFLDDDVMMERAIYALRALRADATTGCEVLSEPPCQYSIEEVKQRLRRTEIEAMSGVGVGEDEMNSIIDSIL